MAGIFLPSAASFSTHSPLAWRRTGFNCGGVWRTAKAKHLRVLVKDAAHYYHRRAHGGVRENFRMRRAATNCHMQRFWACARAAPTDNYTLPYLLPAPFTMARVCAPTWFVYHLNFIHVISSIKGRQAGDTCVRARGVRAKRAAAALRAGVGRAARGSSLLWVGEGKTKWCAGTRCGR